MNTEDPAYAELRERYGDHVIGFAGKDPTTEVLARHIFDTVAERLAAYREDRTSRFPLRASVRLHSVRVWETSSSWAEYRER